MDVAQWLNGVGLGQYEALFREHEIDADVLPDLTEADLEKIGVPLGHRKRLMRAIAILPRGAGEGDHAQRGEGGIAPFDPSPPTTGLRPVPLPRGAGEDSARDFAERRPITVMFCDLVGSTSLAARLDAEDWRNLVNAYLDEASTAVTGSRRPCAEEARRRADGAVRLSAGAGERRRARRARRARHPARARRPQRAQRPIGRARTFRPHRPRVRFRRGRRGRRSVRRGAERRGAGAGGGRTGHGARHRERAAADGRAVRRRGQGRARAQGRAGAAHALSHRAGERRRPARRGARA